MIPIVKADGTVELEFIRQLKKRSGEVDEKVNQAVAQIIAQVKERGDEAVREYTVKFDGRAPENPEISKKELKEAENSRTPEFLDALRRAAENIADFHRRQVQQSWLETKKDGVILGQRIRGLQRVGLYVPGGTAAYPSSVLMNAIPAKIAGVQELIMVTPPGKDGRPNQDILAAASIAGVDRVFLMGGAQAAAALAFGTQRVPKVDKIVGPGNIFVATAKKQLYGVVDIDMIAGPSEILVLADGSCDPAFVAADLLSQAEHDKLASAVLITTSPELAEAVSHELERQIPLLPRAEIARHSIDTNGKIIVCQSMERAVEISNAIAPEHLEVCVDEPFSLLSQIKNAGSIFLGKNVPEALGDYFAGPNHTLPTSGTARFSSPLSVDDFVKKSSFLYYPKAALADVKDRVVDFALQEGLAAHAKSVSIRFEENS